MRHFDGKMTQSNGTITEQFRWRKFEFFSSEGIQISQRRRIVLALAAWESSPDWCEQRHTHTHVVGMCTPPSSSLLYCCQAKTDAVVASFVLCRQLSLMKRESNSNRIFFKRSLTSFELVLFLPIFCTVVLGRGNLSSRSLLIIKEKHVIARFFLFFCCCCFCCVRFTISAFIDTKPS